MPAPTPEELSQYDDTALQQLSIDLAREESRRRQVQQLPVDIEFQIQRFVDAGGDPARIRNPRDFRPTRPTPPGPPDRPGAGGNG